MAYSIKKLLDIAFAELEYLEKESKSQLDSKTANAGDENFTKYARDLDAVDFYNGRKQGVAWCDVFVDWCFYKAFGKSAALKLTYQPTNNKNNCGAGCKYSRQYYQKKGRLFGTPKAGDQVFFYDKKKTSISHTGLVYDVDSTYVYTIEGNTSSASGVVDNGGAVAKKKYKLSYDRLAGFGRPAYGAQEAANAPQTAPSDGVKEYTSYTVKRGDRLWNIAKKYLGKGTRYTEIMELNGLKSDKIHPGQVLKIPIID